MAEDKAKRRPMIHTTLSEEHAEKLEKLKKETKWNKSVLLEKAIDILWEKYGNK